MDGKLYTKAWGMRERPARIQWRIGASPVRCLSAKTDRRGRLSSTGSDEGQATAPALHRMSWSGRELWRDSHLLQKIVRVVDGIHHPKHVRRVDVDRARDGLVKIVRSERFVSAVEEETAQLARWRAGAVACPSSDPVED